MAVNFSMNFARDVNWPIFVMNEAFKKNSSVK